MIGIYVIIINDLFCIYIYFILLKFIDGFFYGVLVYDSILVCL